MKASELIKELQDQINTHGDCNVVFDCEVEFEGCNGTYTLDKGDTVDAVYFDSEGRSIHLL